MKKNSGRPFIRKNNAGVCFIMIWLIGFVVFRLFPFLFSLIYSFSDLSLFGGVKEWGYMNYVKIFTDDKIINSFERTFLYTFITVPVKLIFALFVAMLLNMKVKAVNFFRTVFYIPSILGSSVAVAVLWKAMFRDEGIVNSVIGIFGIDPVSWLSEPEYALSVISLLRIWQFGSSMVVFLAALKAVPPQLYEAAEIDGAGRIKRFFKITIPFISPVIFYNLITLICQTLQEFNAPFIITQGGPRNSTELVAMQIYSTAFQMKDIGLASAMTWTLFIVTSIISSFIFISQKYWVYYDGENL